ncbi:uncharacterized protein LOC118288291 isoform X3 [Scophthalmus maximus]|uniref:uncharacterized protein LOC118288291 isoform X3 n=1 Tax=Scophthalmus maximus TaxID=52904 RepID=UPI001FA8F6B1|nr:uncharacterized protein LOC118288291 isoform X3 [Scophthalmus maximus]
MCPSKVSTKLSKCFSCHDNLPFGGHVPTRWLISAQVCSKETKYKNAAAVRPVPVFRCKDKLVSAMHLTQNGFCFGVLLIHVVTTLTLPSAARCEPADPVPARLANRDGTRASARPEQRLGPRTASSRGDDLLKSRLGARRGDGQRAYSSSVPSEEDCVGGHVQLATKGKFYVVGQLQPNVPGAGYQSDSASSAVQAKVRGQWLSGSEESWQKLQPVVECGDDAMSLVVRRRRAGHLLLARVNESSVPLSQLPPLCGYSVQTTWRDLSLMAQYDACHVTQEDESYVLPLLWRGTPVKMSCPVPQAQPRAMDLPSMCCSLYGMAVKVQGLSPAEELRINVRGEWTPLVLIAEQCGYTLDMQGAEIVITAPYLTCGMSVKDEKYILYLQIGEKTFTLSCPVSPTEELPLVNRPHHLSWGPAGPIPETLEPFPWATPFYLAPPYYPHPTYHHTYQRPDVHDAHNPIAPSSLTPDLTFGPQPVDSQPVYPEYYSNQISVEKSNNQYDVRNSLSSTDEVEHLMFPDPQQKQGPPEEHSAAHSPSSAAGSSVQVEAPSPHPPSHAFNPYYHYYHHPKIPLPGPPQDPDPRPEEKQSSTNSHTYDFSALPPDIQQSDANSDRFPQPAPEADSPPHIPPTSPEVAANPPAPYAQPYPYHYFYYFPHMARGEAKRLTPLHHDMAAKINLPDHASVLPVHEEYNVNSNMDQPNVDEMINTEKYKYNPLLTEEDDKKPQLNDKERRSTPVIPAVQPPLPPGYPPEPDPVEVPPSNHNPPPYPYFYHPYYHYYQMYYGPESLQSTDEHFTSSKEASDPLLQASSSPVPHPSHHKHQTTTSPTESTYDGKHGPLHPYYYYYHLLYQPEVSKDDQELNPERSVDSEKPSSESQLPSDSDHHRMGLLAHDAEAGDPSIPQPAHNPSHSLYSHYVALHHPHDVSRHPGGEDAEDRTDNEMRDCTMGQHFVLVVPDSALDPSKAPHPPEDGKVSCILRRLTSDPDIYIMPLDGCGVNQHVFHHLLEGQGIHSLQQDHNSVHDGSPVSSSPGSPGEGSLRVMDQPPPPPVQTTPATVTVQLRIAKDESFTSFHPEAPLPLGLIRGRPLYLEVSLPDPPEADLVLLVHSCMAYAQTPYTSWMLIYEGCPSRYDSQLLPSPDPHHVRRIMISNFLSLPSQSPSYKAKGEYSLLDDPEIYFMCMTVVCSAADGDCTVGCINSPNAGT